MSEIKKIVVGETTEIVIRTLFDQRIQQESTEQQLNTISRAMKIKDLKSKVIGFIKRNPNSMFELFVPEYKTEKVLKLQFRNYEIDGGDEDASEYVITIHDNFIEADACHKASVGRDIILKIKAE
jgi:hypothetical protein